MKKKTVKMILAVAALAVLCGTYEIGRAHV